MKPFTRELISDRRQPTLRWSAIFAGVAAAVALWTLLQMLGMGVGLSAIDLDDAGSLHHVRIGNSVWSMLAPLIALSVGGLLAGKLASTYDDRIGALHGGLTGAIASVIGLVITVSLVSLLAGSSVSTATHRFLTTDNILITPSLRDAERAAAAKDMGKILLGAGVSLIISVAASIVAGGLAVRGLSSLRRGKHDADGHPHRRRHDTVEVPVAPPPAHA